MTRRARWLILLMLGLLLVGCAADPKKQAEADAITRASIQAAADAEAARQQALMDRQQERVSQANTSAQVAAVVPVVLVVGAVATGIILVCLALVIVFYVRAKTRAEPAPPQIQRYPVFFQPVGNAKYLITDSVTGKAELLDVRTLNAAHRDISNLSEK